MAQRKKRATVRKGKSTARGKVRKASMSARGKSAKRTVAKAMPKKRLPKLKPKRAGAKKMARKKVRPTKPPMTSAVVETIIADVIEEPVPVVMQIENDYDKEVYNGDIGHIDDVDPNAGEIVVSFDGRSVTYGFGELDMLVPAYAATIYKSQGSEYPAVIIPVLNKPN